MQPPPPSPDVGTTGPTLATAEQAEREQEEQNVREQASARKQGEEAALLDLLAPDEAGIVEASVSAGEVATRGFFCAFTLAAAVLASYWMTIPPGLAAGDRTGTFVAAACRLGATAAAGPAAAGQQHPVPALLLTALALRVTPPSCGSPAWRANLVSAACMAVATGLIFLCVDLIGRANARRVTFLKRGVVLEYGEEAAELRTLAAAGTAALFFAWSTRVWEHAIKAGAVAVDALLLATALYAALQFASTWNARARCLWGRAGACLAGFAHCNQPASLVAHGPLLLLQARDVALDLGAVLALSLLPCAYMPLWAVQAPLPDWGSWALPWPLAAARLTSFTWDLVVHQGLHGVVPLLALVGVAACLGQGIGRFLLPARYTGDAATVVAARNRHIRTALDQLPDAPMQKQRGEVDQREREARQASARVVWAIACASILSLLAAAAAVEPSSSMVSAHLLLCLWAGAGLDYVLQQLSAATAAHGGVRRTLQPLGACTLCIGLPLLQMLLAQRGGVAGAGGGGGRVHQRGRCVAWLCPQPLRAAAGGGCAPRLLHDAGIPLALPPSLRGPAP